MNELQFIIPDLDLAPIQKYLQSHANHALDVLSDPDTPLTSEFGAFELRRLAAAAEALEDLNEIYHEWQWKRKIVRESIISLLESWRNSTKNQKSQSDGRGSPLPGMRPAGHKPG